MLQPGAYKAPLVFTGIRSFKQFGLKVLVRWAGRTPDFSLCRQRRAARKSR